MPRSKVLVLVLLIVVIASSILLYYVLHERGAGEETTTTSSLPVPEELSQVISRAGENIVLRVDDFSNGSMIPSKYTCSGEDKSPEIIIEEYPENTRSFIIIIYDPDAPHGFFYHWVMYNIPANQTVIPEGVEKKAVTRYGYQGPNDFPSSKVNNMGYSGPCPPSGEKHRYVFVVLALDEELPLAPGASVHEVLLMVENHVIGYGVYYGVYQR